MEGGSFDVSDYYYPFGMMMPGRSYSAAIGYRYGFNGKEKDNEVKGEGNQQDYGMRIYDPRLGRWISVDPMANKFPHASPYNYVENNPTMRIDPDGADWIVSTFKGKDGSTQIKLTFAGAILNSSGQNININRLIANEVKAFEKVFGQGNVHANLMLREIKTADELSWHESLIDI